MGRDYENKYSQLDSGKGVNWPFIFKRHKSQGGGVFAEAHRA